MTGSAGRWHPQSERRAANGLLVPGEGTLNELNLYHWSDDGSEHGSVQFVATLSSRQGGFDDATNWSGGNGLGDRTASVSLDGRYLSFISELNLTGFPSDGPSRQVFLYDSKPGAETLVCASCNTLSGGPPTDAAAVRPATPGGSTRLENEPASNVSSDGQVFFQTAEALLPQDINEVVDVYVYRAGEHKLISTGKSHSDSYFADVSPDGKSAFFHTSEALTATDLDELRDLYVARIGGGFAPPPAPQLPCVGSACQDAPPPSPNAVDQGSSVFDGSGNPVADDERRRCSAKQHKAKRLKHKAKRLKRKTRSFHSKASKLRRKARAASGKQWRRLSAKAKRVKRKAKQTKRKAKQTKRKAKQTKRKAKRVGRSAERCDRRAGK